MLKRVCMDALCVTVIAPYSVLLRIQSYPHIVSYYSTRYALHIVTLCLQ